MNYIQCKVSRLGINDVDEIRKKTRIGDTVNYPLMVFERGEENFFTVKLVPAVVVGRFPHLVQVRLKGRQENIPVRTITYVELAAQKKKIKLN